MDSDLDLISAKKMLEWIEELGFSEAISEKLFNRFNTKADENAKITVPQSIERLPTLSVHVPMEEAAIVSAKAENLQDLKTCLLYTSPSPRDLSTSRMPSSA